MANDDLQDLISSVEAARMATRPDLDGGFCRQVVEIEADNSDDEAAAMDAIQKLVEKMVAPASGEE